MGTSVVKVNPDDTTCPSKIPAVSVPAENLQLIDGSLNRSYILQLNVSVLPNYSAINNTKNEDGKYKIT